MVTQSDAGLMSFGILPLLLQHHATHRAHLQSFYYNNGHSSVIGMACLGFIFLHPYKKFAFMCLQCVILLQFNGTLL